MSIDPHLFVVLGATGDLFARKLLPAINALRTGQEAEVVVLGAATTEMSDDEFRALAREALMDAGHGDDEVMDWCAGCLHYEPVPRDAGYEGLAARIDALESERDLPGNRVLYLALPPTVFPTAIEALGTAGLASSPGWTRLVVEKPFGRDLDSAVALNEIVHTPFDESQIFRIDHYLGKETVQNLLVFRFLNPIFEASWNRDRVERVEITVAESLDVEGRGRYYDTAGALRDMIQNHLTQVLTLVAMESPVTFDADAIRDEKVKVLRSISPIEPEAVVLGQYTAGDVDGESIVSYRDEEGVPGTTTTETFAAIKLEVDNWRWQGVPFLLRTGKAMERRVTQVAVTFRRPPVCLFHGEPDGCIAHSDVLYLTLQPDEGFRLEIEVKEPGVDDGLRTIPLSFSYSEEFGRIPDAYETLLADVALGDQTLFVRGDEVEASWRLYTPLIQSPPEPIPYAAGTWGPDAAHGLLGDTQARWATGGGA
jgi:glucose-6-phosphate 1-dehydrogenase